MSAFVDTNILAYQFDDDDPERQQTAREALRGAQVTLHVSTQVLIELHAVLTRRLGLSRADAARAIDAVPYAVAPADRDLVLRAATTARDHELSIFDALVIEAAAATGCDELWTEDLASGTTLRGVRIVNPLTASSR